MNEFVRMNYFIVRCDHSATWVLPGSTPTAHSFQVFDVLNNDLLCGSDSFHNVFRFCFHSGTPDSTLF